MRKSSRWLLGETDRNFRGIRKVGSTVLSEVVREKTCRGSKLLKLFPCRWHSSTEPLDCDAHFPRMQYVLCRYSVLQVAVARLVAGLQLFLNNVFFIFTCLALWKNIFFFHAADTD